MFCCIQSVSSIDISNKAEQLGLEIHNTLRDLHLLHLVKVTYPFFCYIKIEVGLPVAKVGITLAPKTSIPPILCVYYM